MGMLRSPKLRVPLSFMSMSIFMSVCSSLVCRFYGWDDGLLCECLAHAYVVLRMKPRENALLRQL
jgi:hypothetical protein